MTDKTPRGIRLNNPMLLRVSPAAWHGKIVPSGDPDFERFDTLENGIRAGARNFLTHWRNGAKTVRLLIAAHAPPCENPTENYEHYVAGACGVGPDQPIDLEDLSMLQRLVSGSVGFETGHYPVDVATLRIGCARAFQGAIR